MNKIDKKLTYKLFIKMIYFILITAFCNGFLRISGSEILTAFRLLIPLGAFLLLVLDTNLMVKCIVSIFIFWCISLIHCKIVGGINPAISYASLDRTLLSLINYSVIIFVFYILIFLEKKDCKHLNQFVFDKSILLMKLLMIIAFVKYTIVGYSSSFFGLNVNNLGCIIITGQALMLSKSFFDKNYFKLVIWLIFINSIFLLYDCKVVLLGSMLQMLVYWLLISNGKHQVAKRIIKLVCIISLSLLLFFYVFGGIDFIYFFIIKPITMILTGQTFLKSESSISFRVNVIVTLLQIIKDSWGFGIGVAQSGAFIGNKVLFCGRSIFASHAWYLELMADFGWLFGIVFFREIIICIMMLFKNSNKTMIDYFRIIIILSFPIWSLSASGLYTEYFCLFCILFAITAKPLNYH